MSDLEIRPLDPHDDDALREWYDVYRAAETDGREYHQAYALEELRAAFLAETPALRRPAFSALLDGSVVGTAALILPLQDNRSLAECFVHVAPEHRRQGTGSALLAEVERVALDEGRTTLTMLIGYPAALSADGAGWPGVEFARSQGFTFGLGDLQRVLDLPVPQARLDDLAAGVVDRHVGYTFRSYTGTPSDVLLELGGLRAAVEVEAPTGEIAREPGHVDEATVRADEAELASAGRVRYGVVAIAADGALAGYTEVVRPEHDPPWLYQWGTLVWSEHRGHGLGLAMKVLNVVQVQAACPDRTAIRTWNADVNAPMIAVNDAIGFRVVERMGEFQKALTAG